LKDTTKRSRNRVNLRNIERLANCHRRKSRSVDHIYLLSMDLRDVIELEYVNKFLLKLAQNLGILITCCPPYCCVYEPDIFIIALIQ